MSAPLIFLFFKVKERDPEGISPINYIKYGNSGKGGFSKSSRF
jgi:hypothetical protein